MIPAGTTKHGYTATGLIREWAYEFPITSTTDIKVYITSPTGTTTEVTSNFTVNTSRNVVIYPTEASGLDLLASGWKMTLLRKPTTAQGVDFQNQGFDANTLEGAVDKAFMLIQMLEEQLQRAIVGDVSESSYPTLPKLIAGYLYSDGATLSFTTPTSTTYNGTFSRGLAAARPSSPSIGDIYVATDTKLIYICTTARAWDQPITDVATLAGTIALDRLPGIPGSKLINLSTIGPGAGVIPAANLPTDDNVKLTGNQTIADVKSFSSFPITPSSAPISDYQMSNKKYIDDLCADIVTGWTDISSLCTEHGWAAGATITVFAKKIGKTAFVQFQITGTVDDADHYLYLPAEWAIKTGVLGAYFSLPISDGFIGVGMGLGFIIPSYPRNIYVQKSTGANLESTGTTTITGMCFYELS